MATASASYKYNSWLTYTVNIDYTAGNGSLTINSISGTVNYSGSIYDCNRQLTHSLSFPGGSGTITTLTGSGSSGNGTGWKSGSAWVWNFGGAKTFSGSGSGDLKLTIASNSSHVSYWPDNHTFNFGNIDVGSAQDPAPYDVSINPTASGRTSIDLDRHWQRATYCHYNIAGWGWISEGSSYSNGVHCDGNSVTGLSANTTYSCQVRFGNGNSELTYSNTANCTTSGNAPSVSSVSTTPARTSCSLSISVSYDTNASFSSREVQYGTSTSYGSSTTSTSITGLSPNTTYYYRVRVTDNWSRTSGWKTGSFKTTCNKPSSLSITDNGKTYNSISVKVSASGDTNAPITNYTLYYKKSSASSYTSVSLGTSTTKTVTGLEDNTTYNLYFTATNAGGTTTSSTINITTIQGRAIQFSSNGSSFARRRLYISVNGGAFKLITKPGLHVYVNGTKKL